MSQQSTMKTVIPYFLKWKARFPDLSALLNATEAEVLEQWTGLGYYSRARNIKKSATLINAYFQEHGRWPQDPQEWIQFPGIGPYTARAICSIALGKKTLPIDGNVIRVLSRFWLIADPLNSSKGMESLHRAVDALIDHYPKEVSPASFTQAFMELGATLCRPGEQAVCLLCPLKSGCQAFKKGKVKQIPATKIRPAPEEKIHLALYYKGPKGEMLLRHIPKGQRLAGHFELPHWILDKNQETFEIINKIKARYEVFGPLRHSITRFRYDSFLVLAGPWGKQGIPKGHRFWTPSRSSSLVIPTTLTQKLLKLLHY